MYLAKKSLKYLTPNVAECFFQTIMPICSGQLKSTRTHLQTLNRNGNSRVKIIQEPVDSEQKAYRKHHRERWTNNKITDDKPS